MNKLVEGKGGVSAVVIAKSVSSRTGIVITTFEIDFHRWILAEHNTHRILSRNGASSRAIPLATAIENVRGWGVEPLRWGLNQAGMKAKDEELSPENIVKARVIWDEARNSACKAAEALGELGLHKQWAARLLEPFSLMKMVVSATDWGNFFNLRNHSDAQPEIQELARCMMEATKDVPARLLKSGQWHLPYYEDGIYAPKYDSDDPFDTKLKNALMISSSCCAQVSYRKHDDSLDKAKSIYDRLLGNPPHLSPFEHQATPIYDENDATHFDTYGEAWSGNFRGWQQYRQIIMETSGYKTMTCEKE